MSERTRSFPATGQRKRPLPGVEGGGAATGTRLDWVDTGRGLAITLVALFHATNWISGTGLDTGVWADVNTVLSSLRMPLFFALSGIFAAKWLTARWADLVRTKVLLFLWVLIVWSLIGMVIQQTGLAVAGKPINLLGAVRGVFLSPFNPPFELWFIWALALFFMVAKATRRVPPVVQLALAGALSAVGLTIWLNTTTGLTGSAKFYFFFLCGLYLRSMILKVASARNRILVPVVLFWAAVSTTLFLLDLRGFPGAYFLNGVLGVIAGVAVSRWLIPMGVFRRLGTQTLPIYLAHTPIVILASVALILFPPLFVAASFIHWLVPPIAAAAAISGALLLHRACASSFLRHLYEPPAILRRLPRLRA